MNFYSDKEKEMFAKLGFESFVESNVEPAQLYRIAIESTFLNKCLAKCREGIFVE